MTKRREDGYVLKERRYDGTESVAGLFETKKLAQRAAKELNDAYQAQRYYVEPFYPKKLSAFTNIEIVRDVYSRRRLPQ